MGHLISRCITISPQSDCGLKMSFKFVAEFLGLEMNLGELEFWFGDEYVILLRSPFTFFLEPQPHPTMKLSFGAAWDHGNECKRNLKLARLARG